MRLSQQALQVVVGKMKVAAQAELWRGPHQPLQALDTTRQVLVIVVVAVVGVRRSHQVGDPVGRRHPAHLDRHVPGFRPVIDLGQDMAVNVDHFNLSVKQNSLER